MAEWPPSVSFIRGDAMVNVSAYGVMKSRSAVGSLPNFVKSLRRGFEQNGAIRGLRVIDLSTFNALCSRHEETLDSVESDSRFAGCSTILLASVKF